MNRSARTMVALAAPLTLGLLGLAPAQAQTDVRHARHHIAKADAASYRPLTVGGHRRYGAIYQQGNTIIAPGGFSAHGYGYGVPGSEQENRAMRNADVRNRTDGVYGYGFDGLGGTQLFGDRGESGYNNPNWGNAFNSYVGYNGVPTALAFGPGYASRYITDHEPDDDDDAKPDVSWPSPGDLGFAPEPASARRPVAAAHADDDDD